ncbi:hypothetical protein [Streptomyces sp. NPDC056921]
MPATDDCTPGTSHVSAAFTEVAEYEIGIADGTSYEEMSLE